MHSVLLSPLCLFDSDITLSIVIYVSSITYQPQL